VLSGGIACFIDIERSLLQLKTGNMKTGHAGVHVYAGARYQSSSLRSSTEAPAPRRYNPRSQDDSSGLQIQQGLCLGHLRANKPERMCILNECLPLAAALHFSSSDPSIVAMCHGLFSSTASPLLLASARGFDDPGMSKNPEVHLKTGLRPLSCAQPLACLKPRLEAQFLGISAATGQPNHEETGEGTHEPSAFACARQRDTTR
jgi:hypothetical protein